MKKIFQITAITSCIMAFAAQSIAQTGLQALTDQELSQAEGQALLNLGYTEPTGAKGSVSDFGFYKLGLEGELEINANIRNLQLGCGGVNGAGGCDIDMENVALSGLPDSYAADGTPQWDNGRPSSSAKITNPFIEFAIRNPTSSALREVSGIRLSAEQISGLLTAGVENLGAGQTTTDGIKSFSGYLQVADTPVSSKTEAAVFGKTYDQMIYAQVHTAVGESSVFSNIQQMNGGTAAPSGTHWGTNVAEQAVNFIFPQTTIQGNRMSQLNLVVEGVPINPIAIAAGDGALYMRLTDNILTVNNSTFYMGEEGSNSWTVKDCAVSASAASCGLSTVQKTWNDNLRNAGIAVGQMGCLNSSNAYDQGACTYITNLKANVTVKQNFNLVHNLPIESGGYLSLQKESIHWPGANSDDIAQTGWWMSFQDPLNFGALNPTQAISMQDVLPQIATLITDYMATPEGRIDLGIGDALGQLFGLPLYKPLGNIDVAGKPAVLTLENLPLDNHQAVVSNCWGNLKFC